MVCPIRVGDAIFFAENVLTFKARTGVVSDVTRRKNIGILNYVFFNRLFDEQGFM